MSAHVDLLLEFQKKFECSQSNLICIFQDKVEIAVESSNSNERMKEVAKDAEQSTKFQYFKSQEEKKSAILELMKNSCFHRTFICQ